MSKITITEALAEIKTIGKRIAKQVEFVNTYVSRPEMVRDPLDKEGGSESLVNKGVQSILDLYTRWVDLRMAIQKANEETLLTVGDQTMPIARWLVWRREVSTPLQQFWATLGAKVSQHNYQWKNQQGITENCNAIINYPITKISEKHEQIVMVLGNLDGQLSLKNATTVIDV